MFLLVANDACSIAKRLAAAFPTQTDTDDKREFRGYPDECAAFSSFADSLVGLALGDGRSIQPPVIGDRHAIVVDFHSGTETEAQASLARGWYGAREFPMRVATTVAART